MEPIFIPGFVEAGRMYDILREEAPWENREAPRDECFMAIDTKLTYSYGSSEAVKRTYYAKPMHPSVIASMLLINMTYKTEYNVCVLNYYEGRHNHLGWHKDDSPEQDPNHPICVMTFGASRYIYTKKIGYKGNIPKEDMYLLTPGSLFIMPAGFQDTHLHKIPKHDTECGGRISLTFRKLDR